MMRAVTMMVEQDEYLDQDCKVNENKEAKLAEQDDVNVNSEFTRKNELSKNHNELAKYPWTKSETEAIGLIGLIVHERVTEQLIPENEAKDWPFGQISVIVRTTTANFCCPLFGSPKS
jgi:hypothetical protein